MLVFFPHIINYKGRIYSLANELGGDEFYESSFFGHALRDQNPSRILVTSSIPVGHLELYCDLKIIHPPHYNPPLSSPRTLSI